MAKQRRGIFTRLVEGPERSEDYARRTLPSNRWALGWDLIRTNFGKLIKINLLMILFLLPIFLCLYYREVLIANASSLTPFSQNIGFGYPLYPFMEGVKEQIIVRSNVLVFIAILIFSAYFSVGIAGGFYVIRNLVWTEGVFVTSDFWTGVKKNYKRVFPLTLIFLAILFFTLFSISSLNYQIAINPNKTTLFTIFKVLSSAFVVLFIGVYLFSLTLAVTYDLKVFKTILNGFILMIGFLPVNLFFMLFSLVPFVLLLFNMTSIFFSFGLMAVIFFSISVAVLIWTNYSQWVFDDCINDRVAGAKKNKGIYKKNVDDELQAYTYTKSKLTLKPIKPITDYDIEIAELPSSYSRADLIKLEESKKRMIEDSDKYVIDMQNKNEDSVVDKFMYEDTNNKTENK